jgi:poly-beta-1,6-N-acetyl-D-glucosamine synthase
MDYFLTFTLIYIAIIYTVYYSMILRARRVFKPAKVLNDVSNGPEVSILVPAYNEEMVIVDSVKSMLKQDYNKFNIIIINDGSTDNTVQAAVDAFNLKLYNRGLGRYQRAVFSNGHGMDLSEVTNIYKSSDGKITLIDKENGGKSTALNSGLLYSKSPWVLCVDADTLLERNAITNVMEKKEEDATAVSAMIGLLSNRDQLMQAEDEGVGFEPEMSKSILGRIQWLEYLRTFILWRTSTTDKNATVVISGAFGMMNREFLLNMKGYKKDYLGEDMELTMNIHNHGGKVQFISEIAAWTQVPVKLSNLAKQRRRWYRGGLQAILKYKSFFNKKDNKFLGRILYPFLWLSDVFGVWIELFGILFTIGGAILGFQVLDVIGFFFIFSTVTVLHWGVCFLTINFARKRLQPNVVGKKWRRIIPIVLLETFTYHFVHFWWMLTSHISEYLNRPRKWNKFERRRLV